MHRGAYRKEVVLRFREAWRTGATQTTWSAVSPVCSLQCSDQVCEEICKDVVACSCALMDRIDPAADVSRCSRDGCVPLQRAQQMSGLDAEASASAYLAELAWLRAARQFWRHRRNRLTSDQLHCTARLAALLALSRPLREVWVFVVCCMTVSDCAAGQLRLLRRHGLGEGLVPWAWSRRWERDWQCQCASAAAAVGDGLADSHTSWIAHLLGAANVLQQPRATLGPRRLSDQSPAHCISRRAPCIIDPDALALLVPEVAGAYRAYRACLGPRS